MQYLRHVTVPIALMLAALLLLPGVASAHGVIVEHTVEQTTIVSLSARYESGEPMAGAQVIVYAPDDARTPWQTGRCDDTGQYRFAPDPTKTGIWEVQVRLAGHGKTMYVEVGTAGAGAAPAAALLMPVRDLPYTPMQLLLMGGTVVWGCVGTALFFVRRRS